MSVRSSTQFRRSGQRDVRRRRLLADKRPGTSATGRLIAALEEPATRKSENYGEAEFMESQLRLIDLIPRRLITFSLLLLAGVAIVAGLEGLYYWASLPEVVAMTSDHRGVAALDLDGEGSLAVWFSSTTLALAALVAVIVYTVRRHKTNDYQGYYRIWLWAAMCWLLMSIDEASSLHEGFKEMMFHATGTRLYGDGSLWWVVPYFFLLGAVGSRLLIDMWSCRLSSSALITTAACYVVAVVTQLGWILPQSGARGVMLEEGAEMLGNIFLLLAMGLHARYVILDAEGRLPRRKSRAARAEEEYDEEDSVADEWITVDAPHKTPQPVLRRKSRPEPEPEDAFTVSRKLTKGEKKALRKRLLRERLQRERKQHGKWK